MSSAPYMPVDAVIGGVLIGSGTGCYMLLTQSIAGNSGILKHALLGPQDCGGISYLLGLILAGISMRLALPSTFEEPTMASTVSAPLPSNGVACTYW
jgi:uncharacterized membrane protein YedE/YeeE